MDGSRERFLITQSNYQGGDEYHREKSLGYNWNAQVDDFVSRLSKTSKVRALDVGCGSSGRDIEAFRQRGIAVEGLDYSESAVTELRRRFPDSMFYEGDMRDMQETHLADGSYGGIWACASLLNTPREEVPKVLAEFRRLLVPNGVLFVSVKEDKKERERMIADKAGERFFKFFSEGELRQLVEAAGFQVQKSEVLEDSYFTGKDVRPKPPAWICLYATKVHEP